MSATAQTSKTTGTPPHPLKTQVCLTGVPRQKFARFLGISYSHFSNCLNGYSPMPSRIEQKLKWLIRVTRTPQEKQKSKEK
jgi:hypothetical protein